MNYLIIAKALNTQKLKKAVSQLLVDCTQEGHAQSVKKDYLNRFLHERIYNLKHFKVKRIKGELSAIEKEANFFDPKPIYRKAYIDLLIKRTLDRSKLSDQNELFQTNLEVFNKTFSPALNKTEFITRYNQRDQNIVFSNFKDKGNYSIESHKLVVQNPTKTWRNEVAYLRPKNLDGIIECVDLAIAEKAHVLGVGSKFSFSNAITMKDGASNYFVDTKDCNKYNYFYHNDTVKQIDQTPLKNLKEYRTDWSPEKNSRELEYVNVPSSMSVKELNHVLFPTSSKWKHFTHQFRFGEKSLINMGGGDIQTFAGAFSTGTHGSGGAASSLHDMIKSMLIVSVKNEAGNLKAQAYRIEPSNGITEPANFNEPNVILKQDDDLFYSAIVSMGCFGVIHSVIISTMPMLKLHEEVIYKKEGWNHEKIGFAQRFTALSKKEYHYVMVNPYLVDGNTFNSIAIKSVRTYEENITTDLNHKLDIRRPLKNILSSITKNEKVSKMQRDGSKPKAKSIETALKLLRDHDKEYETDFKGKAKGDGYLDYSYKVWNTGSGDLKYIGMGMEFAFDIKKIPGVVDKLLKEIKKENNCFLNSPMSLRFCQPSGAYLAPSYKKDAADKDVALWCYIEVLKLKDLESKDLDKELKILKNLQQFLFDSGGRPHWGLNWDTENKHLSFNKLKELYPKFSNWITSYNELNPFKTITGNKYRVFLNKYASIFEQ